MNVNININIKDILQKLSVFKNNVSLLTSLILVLIAVLLFIPTKLMSNRLRAQVERESLAMAARIARESREPVSKELPDLLSKELERWARDANEIERLAMQTTQRELLSYRIFPEPNDTSVLVFREYGERFLGGIDAMLGRVRAGMCPTDQELERALEGAPKRMRSMFDQSYMEPGMGIGRRAVFGLGLRSRMLSEMDYAIVDGVCFDKAKACLVYVNPGDIAGYNYWRDYQYNVEMSKMLEDCWYYQLGYWVIEDVFATIGKMNAGHSNVLSAPVKRLMRVTFTMGLQSARRRSRGTWGGFWGRARRAREEGDKPYYVMTVADGLTESCTGRLSNEQFDVIHFNFAVVIDARAVLPFMQELCSAKVHTFRGFFGDKAPQTYKHNQISILESTVNAVDRNGRDHARYRYGDAAVVELDLVCEYLFNKQAYDMIKPQVVKEAGQEEEKQ